MIKYLVKETSTATKANPSYAGDVEITYFGREGKMIKREGSHLPNINYDRTGYMLKGYGYDDIGHAKQSYAYKHPVNTEFWQSTVEIVAIEV